MSHQLSMVVQNNSSYTLKTYSVVHSWNEHSNILTGNNLPNGGTDSPSIQITSGYTQYDWFTVQLCFDVIGIRQTDFYCNSSYDQDRCVVSIRDGSLDLKYFSGNKYKTGCIHKAYSGSFEDEINQTDPAKIEPS